MTYFKVHLARVSCSFMGSLFKDSLACGSDPYMMSLSSKCTWRVVVFRSFVRFSKFHSRVVVISTCNFFKVHLARGSCSFMGSLFKVPLARASDPHMSLFSKCTSRVVVVRFSKFHSRVVEIR